jgi:hypothetical protein
LNLADALAGKGCNPYTALADFLTGKRKEEIPDAVYRLTRIV